MNKRYLAHYDTGHDYGEFEFFSSHRAGSRANMEDAKKEARRRYGKHSRYMQITATYLIEG